MGGISGEMVWRTSAIRSSDVIASVSTFGEVSKLRVTWFCSCSMHIAFLQKLHIHTLDTPLTRMKWKSFSDLLI
jgi:hypothetical protein